MINYTTLEDMLLTIAAVRQKLDDRLAQLTDEEICRPGLMEEWSAKDILMHLVDWEQRVLGWYRAGLRGETPATPGDGYNWATLPALNRLCFEQHRDLPLAEVRRQYAESHRETLETLRSLTAEELFTLHHFMWTRNWVLADWFGSSTHKHYEWALRNIKMSKLRPKS
jgi:hypothetical protein